MTALPGGDAPQPQSGALVTRRNGFPVSRGREVVTAETVRRAEAEDDAVAGLIETAIAVRQHRKLLEDRPMFCKLGPPEAFSDELATDRDFRRLCNGLDPALTGPRADAIRWRIVSSCAGWETRPTTEEFYEAVRASNPTRRQRAIILMWATEATLWEILEAWAQRAYTFRQLVRAMHLSHFDCPDRIREINQWAEVGRCNGQEIWNA